MTEHGSPDAEDLRVLVVEDDSVDRAAIRRALRRQRRGIEIVEAVDIAASLDIIRRQTFHCGLVDYRLPDGTALDLMDKLAKLTRTRLPIVILTGLDDDEVALEALQRGAQDYIRKDEMDGQVLWRAIRFAIERTQVIELQQRLVHADRLISIGQLAAGVAHEVNNPSGYVFGNLELLEEYLGTIERAVADMSTRISLSGSPQAVAAVEQVMIEYELKECFSECGEMIKAGLVGMEQIRSIIRGLRNFARIEQNAVERLDLAQVLESSSRMVHNQVRHRALLIKAIDPLPMIAADRAKLMQIFTNLLLNAAQSIEPGSTDSNEIRLTARSDGNHIQISIEDTGCGISKKDIERIFEPFFTTKSRDQGTGLGLPLCLDIVRKHGGDIRVHSREGIGTRVDVLIPIETGLAISLTERASRQVAPRARPASSEGRARVLVIDDEVELGRTYERMLAPFHDVKIANGGRAGIAVLGEDNGFDVIVCDLMMPEIDGVALYEHISAQYPALLSRIVFCSGGAFSKRVKSFLANSEHTLLNKPLSRSELLEAVARTAVS